MAGGGFLGLVILKKSKPSTLRPLAHPHLLPKVTSLRVVPVVDKGSPRPSCPTRESLICLVLFLELLVGAEERDGYILFLLYSRPLNVIWHTASAQQMCTDWGIGSTVHDAHCPGLGERSGQAGQEEEQALSLPAGAGREQA